MQSNLSKWAMSKLFVVLLLGLTAQVLADEVSVKVENPGFELGPPLLATGWTLIPGQGVNDPPSNYAEPLPNLAPNRTMQIRSDGSNGIEQILLEDVDGNAIDASSFDLWTIRFLTGYRREVATAGDHVLRVSLWNVDEDSELAGVDFTLEDPGVGPNSLELKELVLSYDSGDVELQGDQVALRIYSISPDLEGSSWRRTAIIDDVEVTAFVSMGMNEMVVANSGFEQGADPNATGWTSVNGAGVNSNPSNYAERIPGLSPNRTMQLKSDGENYVQQQILNSLNGDNIDAGYAGSWQVNFLAGYRRDSQTNGDHSLRVSLWNLDTDTELAGQEIVLSDPGVGVNSLAELVIDLEYSGNNSALEGVPLALRFTSVSPDLGGNSWNRTAIIDDVRLFALAGQSADPRLIAPQTEFVESNGEAVQFEVGISNDGPTQPLNLQAAVISGTDAGQFEVLNFPATLQPGESGVINLNFVPSGLVTSYQATLELESDDPLRPMRLIALSASVNDAEIAYRTWVSGFGLDPFSDGLPEADPDGDGVPNREEFLLMTSPIDANQPDGRAWLRRPKKATVMMFSAHPDDEGIFFGGALPYYSQVLKVPTLLVGVTSGDWVLAAPVREQELRNAAWVYGMRYQPIFLRFPDQPFGILDDNFRVWGGVGDALLGRELTAREFAKSIRRYRPEVVLTHDFDGEYGHKNHMATAFATVDAVAIAADSSVELEGMSPWQVKKLYVNEWDQGRIFHDYWEDISIDSTGDGQPDTSPRLVADLGLAEHKTQNNGNFRVSTVYRSNSNPGFSSWDNYPSEHWGLYSSTVGADSVAPDFSIMGTIYSGWARGNFLENITAFPDDDGDGLPNAWEVHWFGGPMASTPELDPDGDGISNLQEFILGLDPTQFDAVSQEATEDAFVFQLAAAEGAGYETVVRHYRVMYSSDLTSWQEIADGIASGEVINVPWPEGAVGFVRLEVELK